MKDKRLIPLLGLASALMVLIAVGAVLQMQGVTSPPVWYTVVSVSTISFALLWTVTTAVSLIREHQDQAAQ